MKITGNKKHHIDTVLALLLFGVFAVCILMVLFMGTRVYRNLAGEGRSSYHRRICNQYIITRVHRADSVELKEFGGSDALWLNEKADGGQYVTLVYCYDGYLRELFTDLENAENADPESGEKVLEASGLKTEKDENGLLKVTASAEEGDTSTIIINLKDKSKDKEGRS